MAMYVSRQPTVSEFDETGLLINGWYEIFFRYYERQDVEQAPSLILIENSTVQRMQIQMNRVVSLSDTLDRLGLPDQVSLQARQNNHHVLSLGYERTQYRSVRQRVDLITDEASCLQAPLGQVFHVDTTTFYNLDDPIMPLTPDAAAIPMEYWQHWFEDSATIPCNTAINEMMRFDQ
jgi:hypothetical protein